MSEIYSLDCPECGEPLAPAEGRGRTDRDGNEVRHRDDCRCRWCDWRWYEPGPVYVCPCGTRARVSCDDGTAYLTEIEPEVTP